MVSSSSSEEIRKVKTELAEKVKKDVCEVDMWERTCGREQEFPL